MYISLLKYFIVYHIWWNADANKQYFNNLEKIFCFSI